MDSGIAARSSYSAIYIFMHMRFEFEIERPVRTMCTLSRKVLTQVHSYSMKNQIDIVVKCFERLEVGGCWRNKLSSCTCVYARIRTLVIAVQKLQQDIQEAIRLTGNKTFKEQCKSRQLSAERAEFKRAVKSGEIKNSLTKKPEALPCQTIKTLSFTDSTSIFAIVLRQLLR
jgi:hypothetical protein